MKKILVITYYWPPAGGSGVQRWLKFIKYLTRKNYHCIVYTPENPEIPVIDHSLLKDIPHKNIEIIKTKIFEPYSIYKIITGKSTKENISVSFLNENKTKRSLAENISKWIRGNFFIPDARVYWVKPSFKYLSDYLSKHKTDIIISTGPPHSMHLIAMAVKRKFPDIKWIADFRDPWTNIDFLNELRLTKRALKKHHSLEKKVIQSADIVISVSPHLTRELSMLDSSNIQKFFTITNGFDLEDYFSLPMRSYNGNRYTITYAGLMPPNRNPRVLWKALQELLKENLLPQHFKIQLIGKIDAAVWEEIKNMNIEKYVEKINYLPHSDVLIKEAASDALLLIVNNAPNSKGILTGKLFEYLALQKPLLAIGPKDGDAAQIIYNTKAGLVVDYSDINEMKKALINLIKNEIFPPDKQSILKYSREYLTNELIEIIEKRLL